MDQQLLDFISKGQSFTKKSISNTIQLLDDGASIPFISRYRKEATGSLDEIEVEFIQQKYQDFKDLITRKQYIITTIDEQNQLTIDLRKSIEKCWDTKLLEDLYLPYKRKKKTRAGVARAAGLEPLAMIIFWGKTNNLQNSARSFINKKIESVDDAIAGARDIIAELISENTVARDITREVFSRSARLVAKAIKSKEKEAQKYKNYFDFDQQLHKVPSHRLLAIYRAESEKLLRVKIEINEERLLQRLQRYYIKSQDACAKEKDIALQDSIKRLIIPSIATEFRNTAKEKADEEAINVFSENLRQLLLAAPLGEKVVLALDPGFRSGCKLAVIDANGAFAQSKTIFPHEPQNDKTSAKKTIQSCLETFGVQAIAVGNGTAGRETTEWLETWIPSHIEIHLVNESGASIYSASEVARAEFPDLDLTVRGAISIGRRLMDPLAELVKLDPKNIGVGQYQHDVNQTKLKQKLDQVVVNCVNKVGINVNTASEHLLQYVSGLGPTLAQNIIQFRKENNGFSSRAELKKVARMGPKAFEQAAGFLRIPGAKNTLDNTGVHPESYHVVSSFAKSTKQTVADLLQNSPILDQLDLSQFISKSIGIPTLRDIVQELKKPGIDPRGVAEVFQYSENIKSITDLRIGSTVKGIINNLTKFGAFVDIGIKENGLIHISQITSQYISDPAEKLSLGQQVEAKIIDVDLKQKRISLSLKF